MIFIDLRAHAARVLACLMLAACAREHTKDGAGPSDPNAIQDGAEDDATGGAMSTAGQSGTAQGASGQGSSGQGSAGTHATSVVDAGTSAVDAGSGTTTPADAGTQTDPPVSSPDAGPPHASLIGCRGPHDPGCAECRLEDGYASASDGADWYDVWSADDEGGCGPDCPTCASCSYRDEADAVRLGRRQECEPCGDPGVDPCFGPNTCECYCQTMLALSAACPSLY